MSRHVATGIAAIAAVLVLSACSAPESSETAQDDWRNSPLNKYLSAVWGGDLTEEEQQRRFEEQQKQVEEFVAECMSEQGFEYKPVDHSGTVSFGSDEEWNPDSREWVAQWGYGAVNWPGREAMESAAPADGEWVDPNQEYVESLSESERTAYYEALHGPQPSEEELNEDGSYEYDWETAGCYGAAQHEVNGAQNVWEDDEFADLRAAMEQMWSTLQSDPKIAELDAEWSSCMADAGHAGFTRQSDAAQSIYDELNKMYENGPEFDENLSEEEMTRLWEEHDKQVRKELEPVGEREVELALADLDCREKTDYRSEQMKIQFAIEEQFIEDHKTELEAFKAAAEQRG